MTIDQVNGVTSYVSDVSFKLISDEEIRKLSIIQITNHRSFDENQQPMENSVHDLRLGSCKRDLKCGTCGLSPAACEGHYGHVKLPLPVFNPFLFKYAIQLLELTCTSCFRLLVKPIERLVFEVNLRLLDHNLDYLVNVVKELSAELVSDSLTGQEELIRALTGKLKAANIFKLIDESERRAKNEPAAAQNNRNIVEMKSALVKQFLQRRPMSFMKVCLNCKTKRPRYTTVNAAVFNTVKESTANDSACLDELLLNKITEQVEAEKKLMHPLLARRMFRNLWRNEKDFLNKILYFYDFDFASLNSENNQKLDELDHLLNNVLESNDDLYGARCPLDVFFNEYVLVSPTRFRPLRHMDDRQYESPKSTRLNSVIMLANQLSQLYNLLVHTDNQTQEISIDLSRRKKFKSDQPRTIKRDFAVRSFYKIWNDLQEEVCFLFDAEMFKNKDKRTAVGLKQLIEKKEGLFRKNVMGKRVNFAARSVISPDPYIMVDEIGFPEIFAKRLSFPEPVNDHNYEELKQLVENGPNVWPGAVSVQYENGNTVLLNPNDSNQRQSVAYHVTCNAYSKSNPDSKIKVVNRHLRNGDVLLVNRQPTLHKPSIMAHRARVLPGEKTLRLHYANCKSYNADFDGDEMNAHFPQSFLTRAEGYGIVSVNYQYLVPKDGTPLSGLIQDHIVAATMLSYRGEFFAKSDYQNLVFGAISFTNRPIRFLRSAILKPSPLWSGKQVISTIILNLIPDGKRPPTLKIASKIKPSILISAKPREYTAGGKIQSNELCESQVVIRSGELLVGLFDKSNLGNTSYGLIHTCYELYGGEVSTALLTAFARLANNYLQFKCGFTLGIYDILITKPSDRIRKKLIRKSTKIGDEAVAKAFNVVDINDKEALRNEFQDAHTSSNPVYLKMLDSSFKSKNDETSNGISKECLPAGLLKPFPYNHLQMMIQSGAKGGVVNALQISCLLGQIELEGKRVPLMISGKTLPSFRPYETSPKAGGFVTGRFLTGICPQEYFFHCMAGREGLIDTAVKTSRSGYLQRCLIKHLEGLVVNYDSTVRDSDQSVVQFLYGEDGLDILKSQLLKPKGFPLIAQNIDCLEPSKDQLKILKNNSRTDEIKEYVEYLHEWKQVNNVTTTKEMIDKRSNRGSGYTTFYQQELAKMREEQGNDFREDELAINFQTIKDKWFAIPKEDRNEYRNLNACTPDPSCFKFNPACNYGVLSEQMDSLIYNYINNYCEKLVSKSRFKHKDHSEKEARKHPTISKSKFTKTINAHYLRSHCQPGEAVGLLAAQSIGEPSTQMTLNTFHFAGRGEMNVTLGIPRLREIIMTASPNISTPSMDVPFRQELGAEYLAKKAEKLRISLTCCNLSDVLEYVDVTNRYVVNANKCACLYDIKFKFLKQKYFKKKYAVTSAKILEHFESTFAKNFLRSVRRKLDAQNKFKILVDVTSQKRNKDENDAVEDAVTKLTNKINEDDESSSDEEGDGDADDARMKGTRDQELTYEEPEEEELVKSDSEDENDDSVENGKRKEDKANLSDAEEQPEANEEENEPRPRKRVDSNAKLDRIGAVKTISPMIDDYDFDDVKEEWCTLTLDFRLSDFKIDLATLLQDEAKKSVLHKVGKIDKAFLVKDSSAKEGEYESMIKTEGVSFLSLIQFSDLLDLNRIYSNDVHAIANTFGIEAGRQAIVQECKNVFGVYGIEIDPRHLSLIADYMTFGGVIRGMNRFAINANSSPIQQITFETSTQFLKNATFTGVKDELNSPSARLFIGRPIQAGSGILECLVDHKKMEQSVKPDDQSADLPTPQKSKKRKFLNIKSTVKKVKLDV